MTDPHRLWGRASWDDGASSAVPQLVFGELVKLATPVVTRYQSDLYHDARWLGRQLAQTFAGDAGRFEFFYAVSAWGTSIGTERDLVKLRLTEDGDRFYRVAVTDRDGTWYFEAHVLAENEGSPLPTGAACPECEADSLVRSPGLLPVCSVCDWTGWVKDAHVLCPRCGKDQGSPLGGHNCTGANHA